MGATERARRAVFLNDEKSAVSASPDIGRESAPVPQSAVLPRTTAAAIPQVEPCPHVSLRLAARKHKVPSGRSKRRYSLVPNGACSATDHNRTFRRSRLYCPC